MKHFLRRLGIGLLASLILAPAGGANLPLVGGGGHPAPGPITKTIERKHDVIHRPPIHLE